MYDIRWIMRAPSPWEGEAESEFKPTRGFPAPRPAKAGKPLPLPGPQRVPLFRWGTIRGVTEEFHRCYCQTANAPIAAIAHDDAATADAATADAATAEPNTRMRVETNVYMCANMYMYRYIHIYVYIYIDKHICFPLCDPGAGLFLYRK